MTHYALLGVDADADEATLKAAYRAAARRAHPDVGGDSAEAAALTEAYRVLSDPVTRAAYDHRLRADERAVAAARPRRLFARLRPRSWAALCYLAPVPGFPLAFFVGGPGLWVLRFHAAQAVLSAAIALAVIAACAPAGLAPVAALGGAATHVLQAGLAARGGEPVRLPMVGRVAAKWADRGGRR